MRLSGGGRLVAEVWLDAPTEPVAPAFDVPDDPLSPDELATMRGLPAADDERGAYASAHRMLRRTLSRHAPVAPAVWRFATGPRGRPEVAGPLDGVMRGLRFSLSRGAGLAAVALACGRSVGLDAERPRTGAALDTALPALLGPAQRASVQALEPGARAAVLCRLWTLKAALMKAWGGDPPPVMLHWPDALLSPTEPVRGPLLAAAGATGIGLHGGVGDELLAGWRLFALHLRSATGDHRLALALPGPWPSGAVWRLHDLRRPGSRPAMVHAEDGWPLLAA